MVDIPKFGNIFLNMTKMRNGLKNELTDGLAYAGLGVGF